MPSTISPLHPFSLLALVIALLAGCATARHPAHLEQAASLPADVPAWQDEAAAGSATSLTELIDSPELRVLVKEALANNPGLQQTLLALEQSRAQVRQSGGDRYPELSAGFSASRAKDSDAQYTGSLTLSWQLDLWRRIEDGVKAAEQSALQRQAIYQAARDALAAQVMSGWLELVAQKRSLAIERQRLATLELNEQLILQRYRRGLGSLDDLDSARSSTFSARASVRELQQSLEQGERALNTLLGRVADDRYQVPDTYPQVERPLAGLPEQTLARRPDLQAAWHAIASADYGASVAYKDLRPRIDLQAALEDMADSPGRALLTDPVWSLLGQLTAPLFQGGKLRAAADIADLETAIQYQNYRETLLTAVEEVRNALARERALADRQSYVRQALEKQQLALSRYQDKYRAGSATILDLLNVQQQTYDLEARLDTLTHDRLENRVTLALALGLGVPE